jgi:hypothetical protein
MLYALTSIHIERIDLLSLETIRTEKSGIYYYSIKNDTEWLQIDYMRSGGVIVSGATRDDPIVRGVRQNVSSYYPEALTD